MQILTKQVEKNISKGADINLSELAQAVFEMKKQLLKSIEAQRAEKIIYANEEDIIDEANELTDKVLVQLIKDEYKAGKISPSRLAQILRRLIPEVDELKRILPKIKKALFEEGMSSEEYFDLVRELGSELQSEELAKILQESAEQVGIDSKELVEEIKEYPLDAAKLICLAAEIRKGTGDEQALTDLLVEYVERVGTKVSLDIVQKSGTGDEEHLRQVITKLDSEVLSRLHKMDLNGNALKRLEEKLASRVDAILEKARKEWLGYRENLPEEDTFKNLSVLEILEQSVSEKEELAEILKAVRSKIQSDGIDENDFGLIYSEIAQETQRRREQEANKKMPPGTLKAQGLMYIINKEIARAKRYDLPFSLLSFSAVKAKLEKQASVGKIKEQDLMDAILQRLSQVLRDSDVIGQLRKNVLVALLPQTMHKEARLALRRCLKALHAEPITINGALINVKITGAAIGFDAEETSDINALLKALWSQLGEMALRVKNIQQFM
jgi:GGDEF domain-containing protein